MHDPAPQRTVTLDEFYQLPDDELRYELVNLEAGAALVWVVDPESEQVFTYRSLFEPQCPSGSQSLTADDLLPGSGLNVADIFT